MSLLTSAKCEKKSDGKNAECDDSEYESMLSLLHPSELNTSNNAGDDEKIATIMPNSWSSPFQKSILNQHGYVQTNLIQNIPQGQIIEAMDINDKSKTFIIKKIDRRLYTEKLTKQKKSTESNVLKEGLLLHYLTKSNIPPGQYICEFVKFFEDKQYYYLVMEHCGTFTLQKWCDTAFKYMENGRLNPKDFRKISRYLFWQISVLMFWLHHDMNVAYLGNIFEHILVQNVAFKVDGETGEVTMNKAIQIKLCDFSMAEIFKAGTSKLCAKHCNSPYSAPNVFTADLYDAQKADMWSLGVALFRLTFNKYPLQFRNIRTKQGLTVKVDQIGQFIKFNNLSKQIDASILWLINRLLCYDEDVRFNALQLLQCKWLRIYWENYKQSIIGKSLAQKAKLQDDLQKKRMVNLPYYTHDIFVLDGSS